jgi:PKD repeat protein
MKKPIVWTLIILLLILITLVPTVTADQGNSKVETANNAESVLKELPEMDMSGLHTDIELIEVDPEITNATENWIILAHDNIGKKALTEDIDRSSLSEPEKIDMKKSVRTLWNTYQTKFEAAGEKFIDIIVQSDGSNRTMSIPIGHVTRITFDKEKIREVAKDNNNARLMKASQAGGESAIVLSETENLTVKNITGLRAKKIKVNPVKNNNPSSGGSLRASSSPGNSFSTDFSSSFISDSGFSSSSSNVGGESADGLMAWGGIWNPAFPDTNPEKAIGHNSFIYWACKKMGYPLTDIAANAAKDPDTWTPTNPPRILPGAYLTAEMFLNPFADYVPYYTNVVHMRQDGWNPDHIIWGVDPRIGLAPYFAEDYTKISRDKYGQNHADPDAAVTLGWASHFFSDMANPMHTGKEIEQAWDKLKTPYDTHSAYESYFYDYSTTSLPNVNDNGYAYTYNDLIKNENVKYRVTSPEVAAKNIATFSHSYINTLYYKVQNLPPSQPGTGFEGDPTVQRITDNCVKVAARYTAGLVEYTMKSSDHNTVTEIPVADFTADPNPVCTSDYDVTFHDNTHNTYKNTSDPMYLRWEFGDGFTNEGSFNPTHQYAHKGIYTAKLITWNSIKSTEKTMDIIVNMCPPSADFDVLYPGPYAIFLFEHSSYSPTSWRWEFGDGSVSTVQYPSHNYDVIKEYNVKLTASNEYGSGTRTQKITPYEQLPSAKFSADLYSGTAPLTVQFNDISTGNPTSRIWDFGDGNTTDATMQNPVHTYWLRRSFNVSLTAINAGGRNMTTKVRYIKVTNMTDIGVFRSGQWILDYNIDGTVDKRVNYGAPNDTPVVGDFNNDGQTDIGVFRSGQWILDYGMDGTVDRRFNYGLAGDTAIIGDFNNDGVTDSGVFRSGQWILDYGINGIVDRRFNYGLPTDKPVVGDFNNDGQTDIGVFRSGQWILDYGIDGIVDRRFNYGVPNDTPVVGDFNNWR